MINDIGIDNAEAGKTIKNFNYSYINEKLTNFENVTNITSSSHGCGAMCTGLCSTTCGSSCTGGCSTACTSCGSTSSGGTSNSSGT